MHQKIWFTFGVNDIVMSVAEMKIEAISKITNISNEDVLKQVLALLNQSVDNEVNNLSKNYNAIREQYGDVLQKLAQ